jgi:predicted nucleic acid-binding protein
VNTVYDAGVLIAADRNDAMTWLKHRRRLQRGLVPFVPAPVVAQVSRSPRQVHLQRFLATCKIVDFVDGDAHAVGHLLARAGTSDVIDAHVVLLAARTESNVITSDVSDIEVLAAHSGATVPVEHA